MKKLPSSLILLLIILFFSCKKSPSDEGVITPPTNNAPGNFKIQIVSTSWDSAKVSWTQSIDPDNDSVRYKVYLNDSLWNSNYMGLQYTFKKLQETKLYTVRVVAYDTKNKETSDTTSFTTPKYWIKFFKKIEYGVINGYSSQRTGKMIKSNNNKDYVMTGWTELASAASRQVSFFALKMDSLGNEIWKKYYQYPISTQDLKITNCSNGYLIVGGKNLLRIDENGLLQWQKTTTDDLSGVCVNSIGEIYTVGEIQTWSAPDSVGLNRIEATMSKYDPNGNLIWFKRHSPTIYDGFNDILLVSDNELMVLGYTDHNPTTSLGSAKEPVVNFWVVKFDGNGSINWNKSYYNKDYAFPKTIIKTRDGNFVFTGFHSAYSGNYLWLQMIDANGVSIWNYSDNSNHTKAYSIAETGDNSLVVAGCYDHSYSGSFSLYKFTKTGSKIWEKLYQEIGTYITNKTVIPTSDGGYFLGAQRFKAYHNAGETDQIYIFKTDDKGNWD